MTFDAARAAVMVIVAFAVIAGASGTGVITPAIAQPVSGDDDGDDAREDARAGAAGDCAFPLDAPGYARASELFEQGNRHLGERAFDRAAELYRRALALSEHPYVYFNLAFAQIRLEDPVGAHDSLVAAMRCGPDVLGASKYDKAAEQLEVLRQTLARIEVTCAEPGARVTLDGRSIIDRCPASVQRIVVPGPAELVAGKPGFGARADSIAIRPGMAEIQRFEVDPIPLAPARETRRWAAWKPRAVWGAGVAVAAVGGLLHRSAASEFARFDGELAALGCAREPDGATGVPMSCEADDDVAAIERSAARRQMLAFGAYAVGGALIAAGVTLEILNLPRVRSSDSGERAARGRGDGGRPGMIAVTPRLSPSSIGIEATFRF